MVDLRVKNEIKIQLQNMGLDEIKRYVKEFPREVDFNIVQYGNLLIWYTDIREMYRGFYLYEDLTDEQLWEQYKKDVGVCVKEIIKTKRCPRCGRHYSGHPATSRRLNVNVCSYCGVAEAIEDFTGDSKPIESWWCFNKLS